MMENGKVEITHNNQNNADTEVSNVSNVSNVSGLNMNNFKTKIRIRDGDIDYVLTYELLKQYIVAIYERTGKTTLNIDALVDNVYPKLKHINTLSELNEQIISSSAEMIGDHYDYQSIAMTLLIDDLHNSTYSDYIEVVKQLRNNINKRKASAPIVSKAFAEYVYNHAKEINNAFVYERDYEISYFGYRTLEKSYLKRTINGKIIERPQHLYMRVAIALHFRSNRLDKILETYDLLSKGYFTHATPTLYNAGTPREQLASCFLLGIDDSMEDIGECWKDCACISKYAGGLGINMSNIRINGAYINSTQGEASGMRVLMVFNQIARFANQGGKRAGSIAIYLEPWHGDIFFFLDIKKNTGAETERARDLFMGLMINDIFMERVYRDEKWSLMCPYDCPKLLNKYGAEFTEIYKTYEAQGNYIKQINARDLWFKIMEAQFETGIPYIVYKDAINYKSNQINIGVINGSNLCVHGSTYIMTSNGYEKISDLTGKDIDVWNGFEFVETQVVHTGIDQSLLEIEFSNGSKLKCTPYHKFHIQNTIDTIDTIDKTQTKVVEAKDLVSGMKLINHDLPLIDSTESNEQWPYPYAHGLFCIYGVYGYKKRFIQLPYCKRNIYVYAEHIGIPEIRFDGITIEMHPDMPYKDSVPMVADLSTKLAWLAGVLDGIALETDRSRLVHTNREFLEQVKYLFQTIGCYCNVKTIPDDNDTSTSLSELVILNINRLIELNLDLHTHYYRPSESMEIKPIEPVTIVSVKELEERSDTYCFTEFERSTGMFNGIIAGNCAEIAEVSDANNYSVCNIASICLPKFVVVKDGLVEFDYHALYKVSRIITRNLNNIIDINFYPVSKTRVTNIRDRPIGVGVQGLADVFALFKISFDSEKARDINKKIFETIYFGTMTESMEIAKSDGPYDTYQGSPISQGKFQFDLWGIDRSTLSGMWDWDHLENQIKMYGVRNSLTTACMPTASTAQIMGNNESCEPYMQNIYTRSTLAGEYYIINKYLTDDLMKLGLWNSDTIDLIKYFGGSVAEIPYIPDDIKQIYRTVWEIPQKSIIEMAADRGPFVDQTQSMNLFLVKPNFVKLNTCHFLGWKLGLKTGMYYLRTKSVSKASQFGLDIDTITKLSEKYGFKLKKDDDDDEDNNTDKNMDISSFKTNFKEEKSEPIKVCRYVPGRIMKPGECDACSG